ncbi:MAG TPA: DUF2844 domain-containing protein [Geobacteraceae bacterium]|nr:DUF2844 domain-containing protein [Geobacteraceae bacterium]
MKRTVQLLVVGLGFAAALFAAPRQVRATLGESADSVESDRATLSAVRGAATARTGYTVHTVTSDAADVREYVSSAGVVFGIAWNGLTSPDLAPLLGSYADEYRQALQQTQRTPGRRHLQVKAKRVVVEQWGHMRNMQGRAYVPALIPPGVTIDEIK